MRYFYRENPGGRIQGPYDLQTLQEMAISGRMPHTAEVVEARGQTAFQLWNTEVWRSASELLSEAPGIPAGSDPPGAAPVDAPASREHRLMLRYREGYRAAEGLLRAGRIVKGVGIAAGVLTLLCAEQLLNFLHSTFGGVDPMTGNLALAGIIDAALIGGAIYLVGMLFAALGRILTATLDTAVHTSPFLSDEQREWVVLR